MNRVAANLPARRSSSSEEITMEPDGLQTFIDDVGLVVRSTDDEHEITKRVAERLSDLLAQPDPPAGRQHPSLLAYGRGPRNDLHQRLLLVAEVRELTEHQPQRVGPSPPSGNHSGPERTSSLARVTC
jgi:hypothetical protein